MNNGTKRFLSTRILAMAAIISTLSIPSCGWGEGFENIAKNVPQTAAREGIRRSGFVIAIPALDVPVPALDVPVPEFPLVPQIEPLRDDPPYTACDRPGRGLGAQEREIMDIKARYWAIRVRSPGFAASQLLSNPGSEIGESGLRSEFYSRVRYWMARPDCPRPTPVEIRRLRTAMLRMHKLTESCGEYGEELRRAIGQIVLF